MKYEHKNSGQIEEGDVIIERWMVAEMKKGTSGVDITQEKCGAPESTRRVYYPYREDALVEVTNDQGTRP